MAAAVTQFAGGQPGAALRLPWEDPRLMFVAREPFVSRHSKAGIAAGTIEQGEELAIESLMPFGGVIFSDGVEEDRLEFCSGAVAHIRVAAERANLVAG